VTLHAPGTGEGQEPQGVQNFLDATPESRARSRDTLPWSTRQKKDRGGASAPETLMDAVLPYRAMAYNNAWANHRLLTACLRLSQAEFIAPRTGFFPSLRATLNHILIIDRFYIDAMAGGTLGPAAWAEREPCATAAGLQAAQTEMDQRLIATVEALNPTTLQHIVAVHRGDRIQHERMDRLLLHLFQHQTHHRGQAHAMMSGTTVPPPQLDEFFPAEEAKLRAGEFAERGWTEDAVWLPRGAGRA
jgi:uncharacterized damage-inducible protein DinB